MWRFFFVSLAILMMGGACSGGTDDEEGSSGSSSDCSCSCACCVSLGSCDTPSDIAASNATDCSDKCEARCGCNFSQSYECS